MHNEPLLFNFAAVLVFFAVGVVFIYGSLLAGRFLRPHKYEKDKMRIYECGEPTIGSSWIRYNIRFYMIALVFLVFDVETVLLFPAAAVMKWFMHNGLGWIAFSEIMIFVVVLVLGLAYAWRYGNLDWISPVESGRQATSPLQRPFSMIHSSLGTDAELTSPGDSTPGQNGCR